MTSKRLCAAALALLSVAAAPAVAQTAFPDFDIRAKCQTDDTCANGQYSFRSLAQSEWAKAPEALRMECAQWHEYMTVFSCLYSHNK